MGLLARARKANDDRVKAKIKNLASEAQKQSKEWKNFTYKVLTSKWPGIRSEALKRQRKARKKIESIIRQLKRYGGTEKVVSEVEKPWEKSWTWKTDAKSAVGEGSVTYHP